MMKTVLAWALPLSLLSLGACGGGSSSNVDRDTNNANGDDDSSGDDSSGDDMPPSKTDAGSAIAMKDAGGAKGATDAGTKADAGSAESDAGATKSDSGSAANSDGGQSDAGGSGSDGSGSGRTLKPKCITNDNQVVLIGDSYINWGSHDFPGDLARDSGQQWPDYAIGGYSLATGGFGLIPPQLDQALADNPEIYAIVMDGGGNDVLLADPTIATGQSCTATGSSKDSGCQKVISLALDAAKQMMMKAASNGVRDVVYFFYPHVPANTILSDDNPNEILDYALPMAKSLCDGAGTLTNGKLHCTFIDMVPVFQGHPDWFNEDIHPNQQGGKAMADKVWQVMTDNCIGQKGPKDCCES